MKTLVRWDPIMEMDRVQRMIDGIFTGPTATVPAGISLPLDIVDTGEGWVIRAQAAGMTLDQLAVEVTDRILTIRGELPSPVQGENHKVLLRELASGEVVRTIRLPRELDPSTVRATLENGLLTIRVDRQAELKPTSRKVEIELTPTPVLPNGE